MKKASSSSFTSFKRLLKFSGKYQVYFYLAFFIDLVLALLILVSTTFERAMFDAVINLNRDVFLRSVIFAVIINLLNIPLSYARTYSIKYFSEWTLQAMRNQVAYHLRGLPVGTIEQRHSGDYLSLLNTDLAKLKSLTESDLISLSGQTTRSLLALVYILTISWQLALVSLILTPLIFIVLSRVAHPIEKRSTALQEELGKLNGIAQDNMNGVVVSRSFNLDQILLKRYSKANAQVVTKGLSIAHRLSTVEHADVIYVLDQGRIAQQGTHTGLLQEGGLYRYLYELQYASN